jgi:tRNA G18 (ribose-2'-O)-methylase SpoU
MAHGVDSLNVAVAGAIAIYELTQSAKLESSL